MSWKQFSSDDVDSLTANAKPLDDSSPRACPQCENLTIRWYYHDFVVDADLQPHGITWVWCTSCQRFKTFMGPSKREKYAFTDPFDNLSTSEFQTLEERGLLEKLDELWVDGVLPQDFTRLT